jgi:WD40 repeat protein
LITGEFHDLKLPDATRISSMAWNHDGTIVYYVSNDNTAREFRLYGKTLDGVTVSESRVRSEVESFFIAPDGMTAILNVNSEGALQQALQVLTFAPGDAAVLHAQSVGRTEYLRVMYDREVEELIGLCRLYGFAYNHVVLNEFGYVQHKLGNNGTRLIYSVASLLRIYGIPEQRELFTLSLGHAVNYENRFPVGDKLIAIAAEADRFVFGHGDVITVYCATTGGVQRELTIMGSNVRNIDISPNGKRAAAITDKGTFFVFDLDTGEELTQYSLPFLAMRRPFFTPDGKYICDETTRAVFSAETGAFISAFLDVPLPYTMQPGGGTLVWLDGTYTLRIPPSDEVLETVRGVVRGYAFTQEERRAYYLE